MTDAATLASSRPFAAAAVASSLLAGIVVVAVVLRWAEEWVLAAVAAAGIAVVLIPAARRAGARLVAACEARPGWTIASVLLGALLFPLLVANDGYWIHVLTIAMIFAIMAIGLNIHLGEIGLVNLGYAGLFAIGAYTETILVVGGMSFWVATPISMVVCWAVGGLLGFFSVRTSGDYFALVTLGFGLIVQQLIINLNWLTGGTDGITAIPPVSLFGHTTKMPIVIGPLQIAAEANFYYLCLAALCGSAMLATLYRRVWIGRMWTALRQDSIGVSCFGLNVPQFKVQTVAFGSAFAGLAGSLFAHEIGFISPDDFSLLHSIEVLAGVILGGIGNMYGAILGSIILYVVPEKLRFLGDYRLLMYGAMLVLILIYRPHGLLPDRRRRYERF